MRVVNTEMLNNEKLNIHMSSIDCSTMHIHTFFELVYVVSGSAIHSLNGDERIIKKGDYFILDYESKHSYKKRGKENFKIINCIFVPEFIDKTLKNRHSFSEIVNNYMIKHSSSVINISPTNIFFRDEDGYIETLLLKCLDEFEKREAGYLEIIRSKLIEIIILTMRKNENKGPVYADKVCLYIIKYTGENFAQKDILKKISRELYFSVSYLSRRFKEGTGMSFSDYHTKIKVEQSKCLLVNTDKKVTEIAQLCGYSDMKSFNSVFKKNEGITPLKFRQIYTGE